MSVAMAVVLLAAIGAPCALRLDRAAPAAAAAIWMAALVVRAAVGVLIGVLAVFFVPATPLFRAVTGWCLHDIVPPLASYVDVDGHAVGHAATVVPSVLVAASVASAALALWRDARAARLLVDHAAGSGPGGSVLVDGERSLVAAAGWRHPRIVVSAGALATLDDEELAAGLDHERGHIRRRHRHVLAAAELCRAAAWFLPGSRRAAAELAFHLERDADRWALQRNCPLALASAICKTAANGSEKSLALTTLGGASATRRVRQLIAAGDGRGLAAPRRWVVVAATMLALAAGASALVPVAAADGAGRPHHHAPGHHCSR
jgi:bla regulator protein blaR1